MDFRITERKDSIALVVYRFIRFPQFNRQPLLIEGYCESHFWAHPGFFFTYRLVDRLQVGGHSFAVFVGNVLQGITDLISRAELDFGIWESSFDSFRETT